MIDNSSARPTRHCLTALGVLLPPISEPLSSLDHALVVEAQRLPGAFTAGGVERIVSLKDRVWFKVKTGRLRGTATRLPETALSPWWLGPAGFRRDGDPTDFYASLVPTAQRDGGSSDRWLPGDGDWKRLQLEHALAWERQIRTIVRGLIARSLRNGHAYLAELHGYSVTALARVHNGETYLAIGRSRC